VFKFINKDSNQVISLIETIFAVLTVAACLTGSKMVDIAIGNSHVYTPASAFCFILTFFLSNVISHLAGEAEAKACIARGLISQIIATALFFLVGLLPAQYSEVQESYMQILGTSWILVVASLSAFVISQSLQVTLFELMKAKLSVGLSNFFSVLVSQIFDTSIFTVIAFGLGQKMLFNSAGLSMLVHIFVTQYAIKMIVSIAFSPLVTLILKKAEVNFNSNLN